MGSIRKSLLGGCAAVAICIAAMPAHALEGGSSVYPMGAETYLVGALPPPGWYVENFSEFYSAGRFNDSNGNKLFPHFRLDVAVEAPRIIKVFDAQIFGANPFVAGLIPAITESVAVNGAKASPSGLSEVDLTEGLAWHFSPNLHFAAAVDEFMPFGNYSRTDVASISSNRYAIEPAVAFTYVDPAGPEFDIKLMYDFNLKNSATNYQSGQDFHMDYAAGWNIGLWTFGVGGYFEKQTTNDTVNNIPANGDGFRIEGFAFGPNVQYKLGHILLRAKYEHEFIARNKPQGDALWLNVVIPL
jgi:hypothetical protein